MTGFAGCSQTTDSGDGGSTASASGDRVEDLRQLRKAYSDYHDVHAQGPDSWETLFDFARQKELKTDGLERLRDAGYQVKWGVKTSDVTDGIGNFVLAEPADGGPKLMLDGTIGE
jgi:hypothetical protein